MARPEKDIIVLCIGIGLAIAVAIYAAVKPYPADYDAEGRLLVDGVKMANDTFKGVKANIGKPLPFDFGRGFSICLKRS